MLWYSVYIFLLTNRLPNTRRFLYAAVIFSQSCSFSQCCLWSSLTSTSPRQLKSSTIRRLCIFTHYLLCLLLRRFFRVFSLTFWVTVNHSCLVYIFQLWASFVTPLPTSCAPDHKMEIVAPLSNKLLDTLLPPAAFQGLFLFSILAWRPLLFISVFHLLNLSASSFSLSAGVLSSLAWNSTYKHRIRLAWAPPSPPQIIKGLGLTAVSNSSGVSALASTRVPTMSHHQSTQPLRHFIFLMAVYLPISGLFQTPPPAYSQHFFSIFASQWISHLLSIFISGIQTNYS